jgi:hypothetical protein
VNYAHQNFSKLFVADWGKGKIDRQKIGFTPWPSFAILDFEI